MAVACIIFSHQSKLLAYSFDLPAMSASHLQVRVIQLVLSCTLSFQLSLICIHSWCFVLFFSIYLMFLLYVYTFPTCSCHVVLKIYLLTYLLKNFNKSVYVMVDQGEYETVPPEVSTSPVQSLHPQPYASEALQPSSTYSTIRETCHIAIPNYAVGAIIGAAGANIKRIIRDSNAFVTVRISMQL